ncbi:iron uptake porin [Lyngbya aestuarii]|uniref:iron uptake porin n=1 Tax=Lyngbya aestuarii TaxID=118322 RepID=UPI00403DAAD9
MSRVLWNCLLAIPAILSANLLLSWAASATEVPPQIEHEQAQLEVLDVSVVIPTAVAKNTQVQWGQSVAQAEAPAELSNPTPAWPVADETTADATEVLEQINHYSQVAQAESPAELSNPTPAWPVTGEITADATEVLEQINRYGNEGNSNSLEQVTSVSQLKDVSPGDWAYEALRSLVERYNCIAGYPDGTYRGNSPLSRFEFAAGLNSCLNQIERLIGDMDAQVTRDDLETLQRLVAEFQTELTTIGARVDKLEGRVASLEDNQFSTTTKLSGEVIWGISDSFGGDNLVEDNTVFQHRTRLNFDTSFTGRDRLRTRLQISNAPILTTPGSVTNEGRLAFSGSTNNSVVLHDLSYRFPLSDTARATIYANAGLFNTLTPTLNPLDSAGAGSISRFGLRNPIYNIGGSINNAGAGVSLGHNTPLRLDVGYLASTPADSGEDAGLFNGSYSAIGQVTFQPSKEFALAATYIHAYNTNPLGEGGSLGHNTGSLASQIRTNRPVVSNSYGLEASLAFSPQVVLSGWAGYTDATVIGRGQADVWNYAATLAINDFGKEGNTLGFVVGMEPRLTGTTNANVASLIGGLEAGRRRDPDIGLHIEGFYKFALNNNISITPGVIWLTAPGHNENNDDIFIGTLRTTFTF